MEALRKLDQQFGRIERAPPLRAAPLRDRRPLRPRADAGRDVQAAQRLRPRRARRALAQRRSRSPPSPAATSRTRWSATRSARRPGARRRSRRRTTSRRPRRSWSWARATSGLVYLMEYRRRLTLEEIEARHPRLLAALRDAPRTSAGCSCAPPSTAPSSSARTGTRYLSDDRVEGEDPLAHFSPTAAVAPAAHGRLPARRRHHGRQLLRPVARRGLRVRGADLLPRRPRRPADAAVHPRARRRSGCRPSRSSAPRPCTACSPAGARRCRTPLRSGRARRARVPA